MNSVNIRLNKVQMFEAGSPCGEGERLQKPYAVYLLLA